MLDDLWLPTEKPSWVIVFNVKLVPKLKVKVTFYEFWITLASCRALLNNIPCLCVPSASENDSVLKRLVCVSFWEFPGIVVLYKNAFNVLFLRGDQIWYSTRIWSIVVVFGHQDESLGGDKHGAHKTIFLLSSIDPKLEFETRAFKNKMLVSVFYWDPIWSEMCLKIRHYFI